MSETSARRAEVVETRDALHSMFGTANANVLPLPEVRPLPVTGPGLYQMSAAEYHADPCPAPSLSASLAAVLINQTPAHARLKHPRITPELVELKAEHFDIGEAAHAILLEGRDMVRVLEFPDWRTKASQEARDQARNEGKVPLLRKVWEELDAMVSTTRAQLDAHEDGAAMFKDGLAEVVVVWREGELWMRARLDYLRTTRRGTAVDDYKTAGRSAHPEALSKVMFDNGWDIKFAFYRRGIYALTGGAPEFRFAVQEKQAPFALSVVSAARTVEMYANDRLNRAIERWQRAIVNGEWPAYSLQTAYIELPTWRENAWYDQEAAGDGV